MKRVCLVIGLLAPCVVMAGEKPWAFIQAVGGMQIGEVERVRSGFELPVVVDVSGTVAVTQRPTALNSGLVCKGTHATVRGGAIYLTVSTGVPIGSADSRCPPAHLPALQPGRYSVYYGRNQKDAHRLGEIEIAP